MLFLRHPVLLGSSASSMGLAATVNPNIASEKGFKTALNIINDVGIGIMLASISMGIIGIAQDNLYLQAQMVLLRAKVI